MSNRIYGPGNAPSYFLDVARASLPDGTLQPHVVAKAEARLAAHMEEVRSEIRAGSAEGRAALRQMAEGIRSGNVTENLRALESMEKRALSETTVGQWSTPTYVLDQWVPYRSPASSFADACTQLVLPATGYQIHVPAFSTGADTDVDDLELIGLPSDAPTTDYVADPVDVATGKGYVNLSQQMLDRAGGPEGQGGSFDIILADQIGMQLRASIDSYVIQQAIANSATVTDSTTLTTTRWWTDLADATEQLADSSGVRLQPSHVHTTSDFGGFIRRQIDSEGRPIFLADIGAVVASPPQNEPFCSSGWQGINWCGGGGSWYIDDNLPTFTGQPTWSQVIVWNNASVLCWKSPTPTITCFPQTRANTLTVNLRAVQYIAAVSKFANGVCTISGSGYANLS